MLPHKLFGWPQILRATVPIVTSPDEPLGSTTGLGDINSIADPAARETCHPDTADGDAHQG
ncbi:MAG: hypothetical protein ACRERE_40555, partial [Candidatus Entotheonellia bacterium]